MFSVLFIHTAFWSGESYVPRYFQSLSLLIDVPAFCFISGITSAKFKKNGLHGLIKLVFLWVLCSVIYEVATLDFNISNIIPCLLVQNAHFPLLPVLGGSYWFVPVFCVTVILFETIRAYEKIFPLLLVFIFCFFSYSYYVGYVPQHILLGIPVVYLCLFIYMYLLGYMYEEYKSKITKVQIFSYLIIQIVFLGILYLYNGSVVFNMQYNKFPVQLPYFLYSQISAVIIIALLRQRCMMTFFEFPGKNAICFYIAQGVSSSLIYYPLVYFKNIHWISRLIIMFVLNIGICLVTGIIIIKAWNFIVQYAKKIYKIA